MLEFLEKIPRFFSKNLIWKKNVFSLKKKIASSYSSFSTWLQAKITFHINYHPNPDTEPSNWVASRTSCDASIQQVLDQKEIRFDCQSNWRRLWLSQNYRDTNWSNTEIKISTKLNLNMWYAIVAQIMRRFCIITIFIRISNKELPTAFANSALKSNRLIGEWTWWQMGESWIGNFPFDDHTMIIDLESRKLERPVPRPAITNRQELP